MKSLADLNNYSAQSIEVQDDRPAGVRFEGATPVQIVVPVASNRMDLPMPLSVSEIINYQTANLRWRLSVVSFGTPIVGTTFSFPPGFVVPPGITVTNVANQFIEIGGFKTPEEWAQFTLVRWNLPANYANFETWWVESSIRWFDGAINGPRSLNWDIYDPEFYKLSFMDSLFSMTTLPQKIKEAIVLKFGVFSLGVAPFATVNQSADFNSLFSMTPVITRIKPLFINTMPVVAQMPQAIPLRIKQLSAGLSGAFNATMRATYSPADSIIMKVSQAQVQANVNFTASAANISTANFAANIDNTRLRHAFDTIDLESLTQSSVNGDRLRLFNVDLTTTSGLESVSTKFKGIVNENFVVTGNMNTEAVKTARTSGTLPSNFASLTIANVQRSAISSPLSITTLTTSVTLVRISLIGWGDNSLGQLGLGNTTSPIIPRTLIDTKFSAVAAGRSHVVAIKDGKLFAWGRNQTGQLGQGFNDSTNVSTPIQVGTDEDWINVWAGGDTSIAEKSNGTIWSWGGNGDGQAGVGDYSGSIPAPTSPVLSPTQIVPLDNTNQTWQNIFMGTGHVIAITNSGRVYVWGSNGSGQLGLGNLRNDQLESVRFRENRPIRLGTASNWVGGGVTAQGSFIINSSGLMFAFGGNEDGQLGLGYYSVREYLPVQVAGTGWQKVTGTLGRGSGTLAYSIAIRNGELFATGRNSFSQLGNGNTTDTNSFIKIGSFNDWTDISTSLLASSSFAIRNGFLYSWGSGQLGVLGNESTTSRTVPTIINTLPLWSKISAGREFVVAIGPAIL
jgi:alpha-tubulin suppressor-like RCC1 family protein